MSGLIVLEFNELNPEIVRRVVSQGELPNFSRLLKSHVLAKTTVSEEYSKLEPWIQWVTAHTGKTQSQHGAFNLSDVEHTSLRQIWDVLENRGVPCGVVSPMNARRGELTKGFFIPDPWSVSKDTYPAALGPLFQFLAERVQSHNVSLEQGSSKFSFVLACLKVGIPLKAIFRVGLSYIKSHLDKRAKWKLAAELDRFLSELTLTLRTAYKTEYTSVFLNAVAHYQHHYWTSHSPEYWGKKYPALFEKRNPIAEANLHTGDDPIAYGLRTYDYILGRAIAAAGADSVMVVTGLSQVPFEGYEGGTGFYLYRPFNHDKLFGALNIKARRIAPLMSRDVMLYFGDDAERATALSLLRSARVMGRPLFLCTEETDSRVFCKIDYTFDAPDEAVVEADGVSSGTLKFGDFFQLITFKTGHHCPQGMLIAPRAAYPAGIEPEAPVPLEQIPEIIFRMMRLANHQELAEGLALGPV